MSSVASRPFLVALSAAELAEHLRALGAERFRAAQIEDELTGRFNADVRQMRLLPLELREQLSREFFAPSSRIREQISSGQGVEKLLLELFDGEVVEAAVIPNDDGRITLCLSTQVGCPVQCRFCASGRGGLVRNLYCGEIIEAFLWGCRTAGRKADNLVFMGIGEGLLNFTELASALELLTGRFGLSPRRITISTSGYVPGIRRLAELGREYNLAISLHAPDDAVRAQLIPDHLRYDIAEILAAADDWRSRCNRRYTLEYTLIAGVNDSDAQARELGRLAYRHLAKVNLIPYNDTQSGFSRPERARIESFAAQVKATGAACTRRVERGSSGSAACGQLRVNAGKAAGRLALFLLFVLTVIAGASCQAFREAFSAEESNVQVREKPAAGSGRDPMRDMFGMPRRDDRPELLHDSDLSSRERELLDQHYVDFRNDADVRSVHDSYDRRKRANDDWVFGKNPFRQD